MIAKKHLRLALLATLLSLPALPTIGAAEEEWVPYSPKALPDYPPGPGHSAQQTAFWLGYLLPRYTGDMVHQVVVDPSGCVIDYGSLHVTNLRNRYRIDFSKLNITRWKFETDFLQRHEVMFDKDDANAFQDLRTGASQEGYIAFHNITTRTFAEQLVRAMLHLAKLCHVQPAVGGMF
ncbi:MAG: hypothetical protein HQL82_16775 [Magnetococcales bacterium]|nr:hypothetical protein [Magnetococcales bacterium]